MPVRSLRDLRLALVVAIGSGTLASGVRGSSIAYNVTNLGIRTPVALNDAGQVALNQTTSFGYADPFGNTDDSGELRHTSQSTFTHAVLYSSYGSSAAPMGFVGQVLPAATSDPNDLNSVTTMLGKVIAKPETTDYATGITPSGQVAVTSAAGSFLTDGKTYQVAPPNPTTGLKLPDGTPITVNSSGAVNASGQVAGNASLASSNYDSHAFLVTNGKATDLGSLGGLNSTANAINASGQVVGTSQVAPASGMNPYSAPSHAFLSTNGTMKDLGTLGGTSSVAYGINAQGMVVGSSDPAPPSTNYYVPYSPIYNQLQGQHAFLFDGSKMIDLNSEIANNLNLTLNSAIAINATGQILAEGQAGSNGLENAYLLTPVSMATPDTPTLAPEPSTIAIVGLAIGAAWLRRRKAGRGSVALV